MISVDVKNHVYLCTHFIGDDWTRVHQVHDGKSCIGVGVDLSLSLSLSLSSYLIVLRECVWCVCVCVCVFGVCW